MPRLNFDNIRVPAHPTLIFAEDKKQRLSVVAADKHQPVVLIDGKRVSLSENTPLLTQRAADYGPTTAEIVGGITKRVRMELQPTPGRHPAPCRAIRQLTQVQVGAGPVGLLPGLDRFRRRVSDGPGHQGFQRDQRARTRDSQGWRGEGDDLHHRGAFPAA